METNKEIDYLTQVIMKNESIREVYIGANNIIKKSIYIYFIFHSKSNKNFFKDNFLSWDRFGYQDDINGSLYCNHLKISNTSFYCGFIKSYENDFCLSASNCLTKIPFICEVNCTNQEIACEEWTDDYNLKLYGDENPCLTIRNNCENNSTCKSIDYGKFVCECKPGYNGTRCEQDERPCIGNRNRCRNNSTCVPNGWRYSCKCQDGFTGSHCEMDLDDCLNSTCKNGAICEDLVNAFRCNCLPGFYGNSCEFKDSSLERKQQVQKSFSVIAVLALIFTFGFFLALDLTRLFDAEPEDLTKERIEIRKRRVAKKIIRDLKNDGKLLKYLKESAKEAIAMLNDPFVTKMENTFHFSYDLDLRWIDEEALRNEIHSFTDRFCV